MTHHIIMLEVGVSVDRLVCMNDTYIYDGNSTLDCECGDEDCGAVGYCINEDVDFYNDPTTGTTAYDSE